MCAPMIAISEIDPRQIELVRALERNERDREILEREARRVERRRLVVGAPSRRVAGEYVADLRDIRTREQARLDSGGALAAVAGLFPVVTEHAHTGELGDRDLRLARTVRAHQAHVLSGAKR